MVNIGRTRRFAVISQPFRNCIDIDMIFVLGSEFCLGGVDDPVLRPRGAVRNTRVDKPYFGVGGLVVRQIVAQVRNEIAFEFLIGVIAV